jgi:flagellar biosynthesis chaperone FliJ
MKQLPLVLDMASTGLFDMSTAARYVAMALEGNAEALGRYVPQLRATNNEIIKNGTAAEKAEEAMRILNEKFGGSAQKNLESTADSWKQLKNYLGDVSEEIGDQLLPAITKVINKTTDFVISQKRQNEIFNETIIAASEYALKFASHGVLIENAGKKIENFREALDLLQDQYHSGELGILQFKNKVTELTQSLMAQETQIKTFKETLKTVDATTRELVQTTSDGAVGYQFYSQQVSDLTQKVLSGEIALSNFQTQISNLNSLIEAANDPTRTWTNTWDKFISSATETNLEKSITKPINSIKPPDFSSSVADLQLLGDYGKRLSDTLGQAVIYQNDLKSAMLATLKSIAAEIVSRMAIYTLASILTGGNVSAIGITGDIFKYAIGVQKGGIIPAYPTGGVVGGQYTTGDRQIVRINAGEMVLNKEQQAELFKIANGSGTGGGVTVNIHGDFLGSQEQADKLARIIEERSKLGFNRIALS